MMNFDFAVKCFQIYLNIFTVKGDKAENLFSGSQFRKSQYV